MDLILVIDMISRAGMIIKGKTRKVIIGDDIVSNNFDGNLEKGLNLIEYNYGKVLRKTEIPGHTIGCVNISGPEANFSDYLTTPIHMGRPDVFTYSTITKGTNGKGYKTFIANSSPDPILLDKGTKIANLQQMKTQFKPPEIKSLQINEISIPKPMTNIEAIAFLSKINLQCPSEYRTRYNNLFTEFHDVFSKTEYDLG